MAIRGFGKGRYERGPGFATPAEDLRRWRENGPPRWHPVHRFERPPILWTPPYRPTYDRRWWLAERWYDRRDRGPAYQRMDNTALQQKANNALANMKVSFDKPQTQRIVPPVRPHGQSLAYSKEITSPAYFNNEKWQAVLASHGIIINANAKNPEERLIMKVDGIRVNLAYALTDEQLEKLTAEHVDGKNGVSVEERLKIINEAIKNDFKEGISKEHLESTDYIKIKMDEEKQKAAEAQVFAEQDRRDKIQQMEREETERMKRENNRIRFDRQAINGRELSLFLPGMMFRNPTAHGREVIVGEIRVDKVAENQYMMKALINGEWQTRNISEKEARDFLQGSDKSRYKLFADVFKEQVDIKRGEQTQMSAKVYELPDGSLMTAEKLAIANARSSSTDGRNLANIKENKAFYREGTGRQQEVDVKSIEAQQDAVNHKYRLTAVVDGQHVSYEISSKQYERFQSMDDLHRMKLLAKVAPDIELRTRPGEGFNPLAFLAATAVAGLEVAAGIHMMAELPDRPHSRPAVFVEGHATPPVFYKDGVIPPHVVADRIYEQQMEQYERTTGGMGRGL